MRTIDSRQKRAWTRNVSLVWSIEAPLMKSNSQSRMQSIQKFGGNLILGAFILYQYKRVSC